MMKKVAVFLIAFVAYAQAALAQEPAVVVSDKPGWHKIGEVKADFKTESESISVMGKDEFKSIKLKVTDAPINIDKVVVYYENDHTQELPVVGALSAGNESKVYDLEYPSEEIKKVSFTYRSEPNYKGDKAHVELYGLK
jgi:hypothetical protein